MKVLKKTLARGKLTAHEWLYLPLDRDPFFEIGQLGHRKNDDLKDRTPADELLSNSPKMLEGAQGCQRYL
jgi:acetyl-CoA carboxylase carboxyltransferase component